MSDTEEEILVYADFKGMLHENIFTEPNLIFKGIGFDSDTPVLQIGDEVYEGEYEETYGTNVYFEEDKSPTVGDEVFTRDIPAKVKYVAKAMKVLNFSRIFLVEREKLGKDEVVNEPREPFAKSYKEALEKLSLQQSGSLDKDGSKESEENSE